MGKVKFNIGNAAEAAKQESEFSEYAGPMPPKGSYEGRIKTMKMKVASSGNPMMFYAIELESNHPSKKKYNGCPVLGNVVIMDKTVGMVNQFLDALAGSKAKGKAVRKKFWEEGVVVEQGADKEKSNLGTVETGGIVSIGGIKMNGKNKIVLSGTPDEYNGRERFSQTAWLLPVEGNDDDDDDDIEDDDFEDDDIEDDVDEDVDEDDDVDDDVEEDDEDDEDEEDEEDEEPEEAPAPRKSPRKRRKAGSVFD